MYTASNWKEYPLHRYHGFMVIVIKTLDPKHYKYGFIYHHVGI